MTKVVRYNGKGSSNTLVFGKEYEVVREKENKYTLKGVKGEFDSKLFDEISLYGDLPACLAIASEEPKVGEYFVCYRIISNGSLKKQQVTTSKVKEVKKLVNDDIFIVTTKNHIYVVKVETK